MELIDRLARLPEVSLPLPAEVADSVAYLDSDEAMRSIERDAYWPKWHSPWWHMLLLFELGEARRIPERALRAMAHKLDAFPLKIFPTLAGELPDGYDPRRDVMCHCALGSMYQVFRAAGRDPDAAIPWAEPWFLRYQMRDGGFNCDETAYGVEHECPSSMVGTLAPFEAMLRAPLTEGRAGFVDRAAAFLVERRLVLGSSTVHNAEERARAPDWLRTIFPRFYFYDVLRGLNALTRWAELRDRALPRAIVEPIVTHLLDRFPDGVARVMRPLAPELVTLALDGTGTWVRVPAVSFPLLDAVGRTGVASFGLTSQWAATRTRLLALQLDDDPRS